MTSLPHLQRRHVYNSSLSILAVLGMRTVLVIVIIFTLVVARLLVCSISSRRRGEQDVCSLMHLSRRVGVCRRYRGILCLGLLPIVCMAFCETVLVVAYGADGADERLQYQRHSSVR